MRGKEWYATAHRGQKIQGGLLNLLCVPGWSVSESLAGWGTGPQLCGFFWVNGFFCTGFMKYFDFPSLFMSVPAEVINEKVKQYVKGETNKPDFMNRSSKLKY